jgi:hypothetical protein
MKYWTETLEPFKNIRLEIIYFYIALCLTDGGVEKKQKLRDFKRNFIRMLKLTYFQRHEGWHKSK